MKKAKSTRKLERHFKGVSNHWRIDILLLIARRQGITLDQITDELGGNFKTMSEHARRLVIAGLVEKAYEGTSVRHALTPYGKVFARFIADFANLKSD